MSASRVYFVGAGPGAADLLTVRATQLLARADVVLHDALVDPAVLALASRARLIAVGNRAHSPSTEQHFINKALIDYARTMNCVVRLEGGDPSIFGRLDEEMQALRAAGVASEVVPRNHRRQRRCCRAAGSLTLRAVARSVTFLTPCVCDEHDDATWLPAAASVRAGASLVVYIAGRQIVATAQRLIASGCAAATPIAVLESVSSADARQWVGTLAEAATSAPAIAGGPVVLLIGKALRSALDRATSNRAVARAA